MYRVEQYNDSYKKRWDEFIQNSKNGTFLLKRDYVEYHKDKFPDLSFLILDKKNKIRAVIAGTLKDKIYYTHKGLTYGGFIIDRDSKVIDVWEYFKQLNLKLIELGVKSIEYKQIPNIYYSYPSEEDEYILFNRLDAKLIAVSVASVIDLTEDIKFSQLRAKLVKKSKKENLVIEKDLHIKEFWEVLTDNLRKTYNALPVHNLKEILYLKDKFSQNIEIYTVRKEEAIIAGAVIYLTKNVAHVQYISANDFGKEVAALDYLFDYLIKEEYKNKRYFDFGISTENNGKTLNEGLIFQKEGFGARAINYKQYKYELKSNEDI